MILVISRNCCENYSSLFIYYYYYYFFVLLVFFVVVVVSYWSCKLVILVYFIISCIFCVVNKSLKKFKKKSEDPFLKRGCKLEAF